MKKHILITDCPTRVNVYIFENGGRHSDFIIIRPDQEDRLKGLEIRDGEYTILGNPSLPASFWQTLKRQVKA